MRTKIVTITQDQADAILDATKARAAEMGDQHMAVRELISDILDHGGIDQDEYDFDENHPLKPNDASEYLEDGLITPDELREIFSDLRDARSGDDT